MWTRAQLKANAKEVLRQSYWLAFLAGLVLTIATEGKLFNFSSHIGNRGYSSGIQNYHGQAREFFNLISPFLPFIIGASLLALVAGIAVSIFLLKPLEVGGHRFFLESTQFRFRLEELVYGFTGGDYTNVVSAMFLRSVYTFLWTLLLVIPGIVKGYAYGMVPFLLAENPHLPASRAIALSEAMTRGHKWEIFVLDLSFIGWYLLGALLFGVGVLFVRPYYYGTRAQLYLALRTIALEHGVVSLSELEGR